MKSEGLLCCDWGTSNFRLYLVDTSNHEIIHEVFSNKGVSDIYKEFTSQTIESQQHFFVRYLKEQIQILSKEAKEDVSGISVIASGMASSTIGISDVDYALLPFSLSDPSLNYTRISAASECSHDIYVYGGLRSTNDVMRGEEVQLLGLADIIGSKSCTCILPGTHSKHVRVVSGVVSQFETFMTGEVFHLLTRHSILKQSIGASKGMSEADQEEFVRGVHKGASMNLLSSIFKIRTRDILDQVTSRQNYFYLSGLLIGNELSAIQNPTPEVVLCGGDNLAAFYKIALDTLTLSGETQCCVLTSDQMKKAIPRAHLSLYKNLKNISS